MISGGHHVVRVDEESTADVTSKVSQEALSALNALLNGDRKPDVVILEDYDKGLMTESLWDKPSKRAVMRMCRSPWTPS